MYTQGSSSCSSVNVPWLELSPFEILQGDDISQSLFGIQLDDLDTSIVAC